MLVNKPKSILGSALLGTFLFFGASTLSWSADGNNTVLGGGVISSLYQSALQSFNNRDFDTAYQKLLPLAQDGYAEAQYRLGYLYLNGLGVVQDLLEASKWLVRASDQGHAGAQNDLATLYLNGQGGIERNLAMALGLYRLAAAQGHPAAVRNLEKILQPQNEEVAATQPSAPVQIPVVSDVVTTLPALVTTPPTIAPTASQPAPVLAATPTPTNSTLIPTLAGSPLARLIGVDFQPMSIYLWPFTLSTQRIKLGLGFDWGQ